MFVQNLEPEQQAILLHLCEKMMHSDGVIDPREKEMLEVIKSQCSPGVVPKETPIKGLSQNMMTKKQRVSLLLELIAIAHIDEISHEAEQNLMREIAAELEISDLLLEDIENWVKRQFLLTREAQTLMEG